MNIRHGPNIYNTHQWFALKREKFSINVKVIMNDSRRVEVR